MDRNLIPPAVTFRQRLRQIGQWIAAHIGDTGHERRVMRIAVALFDRTMSFSGLDRHDRRLLKLAAMLHDVGRCRGPEDHHIRGQQMILGSRTLLLTRRERLIVAFLTRFHRGDVPDSGDYIALGEDADRARTLLALLRAADTLDSRKVHVRAIAIRLRGRRLCVRCHIHKGWKRARRAFRRRRKFALLRKVLGLRTRVALHRIGTPVNA